MNNRAAFDAALNNMPLIAILRGIEPKDAPAVGDVLAEAGFGIVEVPLNSPDPFASIERLAMSLRGRALVGAGTVLSVEDVAAVESAGGTLVISPNADSRIIAETASRGLVSLPGIATPTEAFAALGTGAAALKLFPAEAGSPSIVKAMLAVLPRGTRILPVGGITPGAMASWYAAGAAGFGLGSALFTPAMTLDEIRRSATAFVAAARELVAGR